MTNRDRFHAVLNGSPADRPPCMEWAPWWNLTRDNWKQEDPALPEDDLFAYFGLDAHRQICLPTHDGKLPAPAYYGGPIIGDEETYERLAAHLYPEENIERLRQTLIYLKPAHDAGELAIWFTFDGFFWFPRTLFGIEEHLYAFYDQPELMHRMNRDLTAYHVKAVEAIYDVLTPDYMTFAEDMSYNHGPMISKPLYDEFLAPYYRQIVPRIKERGTKVLIDTDGDVEPLIPWFMEAGIEGVLPLERQAGVDVGRIREQYPDWIMIGGFDKTIMHKGEAAMRGEFERLLPVIRSGRYIPSVDHQTPPDVDLDTYKVYVRLLHEYLTA